MADIGNSLTAAAEKLAPAPDAHAEAALDHRIARGIRGSFLVSVATAPFGYLTALILARVAPEAVGWYSVLGIYLGIVASVLYFGGGTVTIRFVSEVPPARRSSFLLSYYLLTLGLLVGITAISLTNSSVIRFLLGPAVDRRLWALLLLLAPLSILYFFVLAALKGLMQVTFSQALMRAVTVGSCVCYGAYLLAFAGPFRQHPAEIIFVSYFALLLLVSVIALGRLHKTVPLSFAGYRWFLPAGFWSYALGVQGASALGLLHMKIDQILVLRSLNLTELGIFAVALQIADTAPLLTTFFIDGVLPGVVNLSSADRAGRIPDLYYRVGKRTVLLSACLTLGLLAFAGPVLRIFGTQYVAATHAVMLLLVFNVLDSLTGLNSVLMVGLGRPNCWTAAQAIRIAVFIPAFWWLAPKYGLLGVVIARGIAWSLVAGFSFYVVKRRLQVRPHIPGQFALSAALAVAVAVLQHQLSPSGPAVSGAILLLALAVLFIAGRYTFDDLRLSVRAADVQPGQERVRP